MKKFLFLLALIPVVCLSQNNQGYTWGDWTHKPDSIKVNLTNRDTAYVFVVNPNFFDYENNITRLSIAESTTGNKPSTLFIPYEGENFWNGGFYVGLYPKFGRGTLDSLQIRWYPFDENGVVYVNDVRYFDFSTGISETISYWYVSSVASGSAYGASSNGMTVPCAGYKFMIIQKATSCTDTLGFKIWKN